MHKNLHAIVKLTLNLERDKKVDITEGNARQALATAKWVNTHLKASFL